MKNALVYSVAHALPIYKTSRTALSQASQALYKGEVPDAVLALSYFQEALSIILIFLTGLAIRNHFRL